MNAFDMDLSRISIETNIVEKKNEAIFLNFNKNDLRMLTFMNDTSFKEKLILIIS